MQSDQTNTTYIRTRDRIASNYSTEPLTHAITRIEYSDDIRISDEENFGRGELGQGHFREGLGRLRLEAIVGQSAHLVHPLLEEGGAHAGLLDDAALEHGAVVIGRQGHQNLGTLTARLDRLEVQGRRVRVLHHHLHHYQQRRGLDQIHLRS